MTNIDELRAEVDRLELDLEAARTALRQAQLSQEYIGDATCKA